MFKQFMEDAKLISQRDPASKGVFEVILLYPGFHAVCMHRIAHWFYNKKLFFIARWISQVSRFFTGTEIHPGAIIGKGLFIDHGMGIVIGETAEIGDNCTIYHNVTLGGTGKDTGKRHPTVGNNVLISSGAKILGPFKVGDNSRIGANAVVLNEVEPDTTVVGVPGRTVKRGDKRVVQSIELDQVHIGDPVAQELCKLLRKLENIEKQLAQKHDIKLDEAEKPSSELYKKLCHKEEGDRNEAL
ncbi:UNVERIFIED_CONTAM: serine O-acetyltransferase [Acetivibrio alkalicellulosi]